MSWAKSTLLWPGRDMIWAKSTLLWSEKDMFWAKRRGFELSCEVLAMECLVLTQSILLFRKPLESSAGLSTLDPRPSTLDPRSSTLGPRA
eukprot:302384-Rhodomonas_salina.1